MLSTIFSKKNNELLHDKFFSDLRKKEFKRLDNNRHIYLDFTGGNLYAKSQISKHLNLLNTETFGNPHSTNPTSKLATKLVEEARDKVLKFFNATDYYCIFTANATGALQIVGENYPFENNGHYLLFADNHNSVNGIREYCLKANGSYEYVQMNYEDLNVSEDDLSEKLKIDNKENKLFAFPAQSNVSGIKHDLNLINKAQELGWDVLLDAAAFVPTNKLDLSKIQPNFVSISFYKIFGFPTGIGCLLVHKNSFDKLKKRWFAGGTVSLASAITPFYFLIDNHERFENGTINYLEIPALKDGLEFIEKIGLNRINERVESLMQYLFSELKNLKHSNGTNQLLIFGHPERKNTGSTMILSFINPDGNKIPFEKIDELANKDNISLRSGCFCNPGLDEINNCLTTDEISKYFNSRDKGNYWDMIDSIQKMRGATRISVGMATIKKDLDFFISFVKKLKDLTI